ncbi:MAG TPA: hypothetical protein VFG69_01335 [Nannocystaceae bacterium]|nr:hypothetical protein [Nannocystaceae bacterium]
MVTAAAPALTITNRLPGSFELVSEGDVALSGVARIERRAADGSWSPIGNLDLGKGYRLVERCDAEVPACIELDAGVVRRPVPFLGLTCSSQCNHTCRANKWLGPAELRLAVHGCNGGVAAGPSFEWPDVDHVGQMPRWGIATDVVRATAMRLEVHVGRWTLEQPAEAGRLAGFDVKSAKERDLAPTELATLVELLRSPTGYDDRSERRCAFGKTLVGFRLVRAPATTAAAPREEDVEIAIDFHCRKLFVVQGGHDGIPRTVHATHFDPSRAAWLALAHASLPGDRRVAQLD